MYCLCGCGLITNIAKKTGRALKGQYFRYIAGHQNVGRVCNSKGIAELVKNNQGKHTCGCGCNKIIIVKPHHFYSKRGVPKYIHGHHVATPERREQSRKNSSVRIGPLSPRWKKNRDEVRGRVRCKVDFTRRQKREIYIRDNGICQSCGIVCLIDATQNHPHKVNIDHIIPVNDGGKNEIFNGQVLCLSCHKTKHSAKAKRPNSVEPVTDNAVGNTEPSREEDSRACVETMGPPGNR